MGTFVLGLTGPTGAGKSTVRDILSQRGFPVIDADKVARNVISGSEKCLMDLALSFSVSILNHDGTLNRQKLADIVFADKNKLKQLNKITFPHIRAEISRIISEETGKNESLVILDAPTLFESGCDKMCSGVLTVTASEKDRLNRILLRDRLSDKQARLRINAQHSEEFYTKRANYVIINDGDIDELKIKTFEVLDRIERGL